jgi:hypothetical protein
MAFWGLCEQGKAVPTKIPDRQAKRKAAKRYDNLSSSPEGWDDHDWWKMVSFR